jgi:hypothetical protein
VKLKIAGLSVIQKLNFKKYEKFKSSLYTPIVVRIYVIKNEFSFIFKGFVVPSLNN